MDEETINKQIRALVIEIAGLPKDKHKDSIKKIDQSIADLRICIKYLLLDLEATTRERNSLKAKLGKQNPDDEDNPNRIDGEM